MPIADSPSVSVVIPTYRAEEGKTVEFVVVDDRSPDDTWERLGTLAERIPDLHAIRLQKNMGQMTATLCGISEATGDVVVTMDDDLQHPPEEVPKLLDALDQAPEWDVVIGSWERGNDGAFRGFGSSVFEWLQNLAIPEGRDIRALRELRWLGAWFWALSACQ